MQNDIHNGQLFFGLDLRPTATLLLKKATVSAVLANEG